MKQLNYTIIPTQAAAFITSAPLSTENLVSISAQVVGAGGAEGHLYMTASNDDPTIVGNPVNWCDITDADIAVTGDGAFIIPATDLCYQWLQFLYINTGTGTVTVTVKALGI